MFWSFIRIRALLRLGLGKPFQYIILIVLAGCLVAGMIYVDVVLNAVRERNQSPHVHTNGAH